MAGAGGRIRPIMLSAKPIHRPSIIYGRVALMPSCTLRAKTAFSPAPAVLNLIERLRQSGGTCHLMGLISPGGVHSHQDHAAALAKILAEANIPTVVHAFTDGRDTPPRMAE